MTHIDLFTGIGGFSLSCHWAGIETVVMCENDKRCRQFLERTWPGIPVVPDVRQFDGKQWRGQFLLTAGVPCQPASRAGKQRGKDDDRWLWGEALRIVSEARPDWCLFENPPGIDDVGLGGILADLEAEGYEVAPPLIIPACAVNSPQLRARYWIVAHCSSQRRQQDTGSTFKNEGEYAGRPTKSDNQPSGDVQGDLADTQCEQNNQEQQRPKETERKWSTNNFSGCNMANKSHLADTAEQRHKGTGSEYRQETRCKLPAEYSENFWSNSIWLPCADGKVRRAPDHTFGVVDGLHRSVLAGLGNSIVPQIAYEVIKAIINTDEKPG
jgi:DNA (cytosine-5)-methyltransferase 1